MTGVVDVNAIVADTELPLRRTIGGNIDFVVEADPDVRAVSIEGSKLEQILVSPIINARAAMPDGGTITIRTANAAGGPDEPINATPHRAGTVTVTDAGTGLDAEVARRAFAPFFTTRERRTAPGSGWRPSTAPSPRRAVRSGSPRSRTRAPRFDSYLPVAVGVEPAAATPGGARMPARTILVVEDEDALREVITRILRAAGYQVLDAASPAEVLERRREHRCTWTPCSPTTPCRA